MQMFSPVMKPALSEARYSTMLAMSIGLPTRPAKCWEASGPSYDLDDVSIMPGERRLVREVADEPRSLLHVDYVNRRAFAREALGDALAYALRPAGDDHHFAFEFHISLLVSVLLSLHLGVCNPSVEHGPSNRPVARYLRQVLAVEPSGLHDFLAVGREFA